ncbi:MAG: N-acetylmuramoyl-L-alanine amidase family protein, partial [Alphaproteobacteria bacterium]
AGTQEKALTLAVAEELKRQLASDPRYQVVLTRESDVFMRLTERVAASRTAGAHLFVSLHADTLSSGQVRGASVYTLSERGSDQAAEVLAAKENRADIIAGVDVSNYNSDVTSILIDLSQRESKNDAARFANMLIDELGKETTVLHKTHRFAAFAVLKAPDVPSVLVELGYLSNRREERELASSRHRAKLAAAIRRAVDAYFSYQDALTRS